ncbi:MAG: hypothetical protein E7074_02370 [Bacteroidales bacterium]|nr:hypothetical protein [Bacteroidales bacterium]
MGYPVLLGCVLWHLHRVDECDAGHGEVAGTRGLLRPSKSPLKGDFEVGQRSKVKRQRSRVESRESRVKSQESRVESQRSRVKSQESRVKSRESKVESQESKVESQETIF